jgi:predicted ATP-dependent endonuclease of OLD family
LNEEMKMSGEDKASVLASLRDCRTKLEESELLRERLTSRMDTLFKKIESQERERETLLQQLDRLNEKVSGSFSGNGRA